jgi:hypothetical protein
MTKLYNPIKRKRTEIPEKNKRLLVRNHSLLSQRFSICVEDKKTTDTIGNLIENYPLQIYQHVYEYKTRKLVKLTLCSIGLNMLYEKMDSNHPDIIGKLRDRKRQNKAKLNLIKKRGDNF